MVSHVFMTKLPITEKRQPHKNGQKMFAGKGKAL